MSLDHAARSNLAGDRLMPCPACVEAAVAALTVNAASAEQTQSAFNG